MHGKSFLSIFDWRKVGDYFLPKTKSSLQHFLSEYGKTSLELTELKVNQVTLDLAHYEKALVDQAPIAKAKELLQSFRVKEMPIQEYLKLVDESDKRAVSVRSSLVLLSRDLTLPGTRRRRRFSFQLPRLLSRS